MGKYFSKNSKTQEFQNVGNLKCPLFEFLKFRIPEFLIIENDEFLKIDEKSKTRNLLGLILPAEFLEKLGYEFSFDKKT